MKTGDREENGSPRRDHAAADRARLLHDLRNEMNTLSMAVALLQDELRLGDTAKIDGYLLRIAEAIQRSGILLERLSGSVREDADPRPR